MKIKMSSSKASATASLLSLLFGLTLSLNVSAQVCFKTNLKQKLDTTTCAAVPVVVSKVDCVTDKVIEESTQDAKADCSGKVPVIRMNLNGQALVGELTPARLWGGINFRVVSTVLEGTAAVQSAAKPAKVLPKKDVVAASEVEADSKLAEKPAPSEVPVKKSKKKVKAAAVPVPAIVVTVAEVSKSAPTESAVAQSKAQDVKVQEVKPAADPKGAEIKAPEVPAAAPAASDSPLVFKASGFAHIEWEQTSNFGYNGTSTGQGNISNFDSTQANNKQSVVSLLSDIQFDLTKDKTTMTSIFEVGEILDGESATGGSVGGRAKILEVRNLFLTQAFDANWSLKAGLMALQSDPNAYIVADHYSSAMLAYTKDNISANIWRAKAANNKPGLSPTATNYVNPDNYTGFWVQDQFNDSHKGHLYGVYRNTTENLWDATGATQVQGATNYSWLGLTFEHTLAEGVTFNWTAIGNQGNWRADSGGLTDTYSASLADARFGYSVKKWNTDFTLEGMSTTGASDQVSTAGGGLASIGKRKYFAANGVSYLLTIATSDGLDEAPGVPKESIIGGINQSEGLQIVVLKANTTFNDKWSGFVRFGSVKTAAVSGTTNSNSLGNEVDLEATYQLSKGALLQFDGAVFNPGSYYTKKDAAQFFGTRWKFSF